VSLLAEEIVEEWLNRQGYFTIRGIKLGVHEIDLLAVKPTSGTLTECRHIEVQASMRPISFISRVPKADQRSGRAANSAKRSEDELLRGVAEWTEVKFKSARKRDLMSMLWKGKWSSELVLNVVKSENEVKMIEGHGIKVHRLKDILRSLENEKFLIGSAGGTDMVDLINMQKNDIQN
jgi:hypothetical protein